jgi:hypothetical protein
LESKKLNSDQPQQKRLEFAWNHRSEVQIGSNGGIRVFLGIEEVKLKKSEVHELDVLKKKRTTLKQRSSEKEKFLLTLDVMEESIHQVAEEFVKMDDRVEAIFMIFVKSMLKIGIDVLKLEAGETEASRHKEPGVRFQEISLQLFREQILNLIQST